MGGYNIYCYNCGKERGWTDVGKTFSECNLANKFFEGMSTEDRICKNCFKSWRTPIPERDVPETSSSSPLGAKTNSKVKNIPVSSSPLQSSPSETVSSTSPTQSSKTNITVTSLQQLRSLTQSRHDEFKAKWDKNGVVQYKDDKFAVLKRFVGQQVQFLVACSVLTQEGYRMMVVDEGMTAQAGGISGGASSFYYFQKMDYVR